MVPFCPSKGSITRGSLLVPHRGKVGTPDLLVLNSILATDNECVQQETQNVYSMSVVEGSDCRQNFHFLDRCILSNTYHWALAISRHGASDVKQIDYLIYLGNHFILHFTDEETETQHY